MFKRVWLKIAIVVIVSALIAAGFILGPRYINLEQIKQSQERVAQWYDEHRILAAAGFMLLYILVTALNIPVAAPLTLLAGAVFGLWTGTILVSFASTIGASLAFLLSRFLLRDWVSGTFSKRLEVIDKNVRREGAFYLFTMRLIPVFPFFLINLAMGLTAMRLATFYVVSQIGMLPGTILYVNLGTQLRTIVNLQGLLSWNVVLSLALIGIFPLAAKKGIDWYRVRHGKPRVEETTPDKNGEQ